MPEYGTLFGNSNLIMKNKVEKNKNDLIIQQINNSYEVDPQPVVAPKTTKNPRANILYENKISQQAEKKTIHKSAERGVSN